MLGSLAAVTAAAIAGVPVAPAQRLRPWVVAVIGVMLGSGFAPEVVAQARAWLPSLVGLFGFVVFSAACVAWFYRVVGGYGRETAFLCAMPGGLTEMVELGIERGADARRIVLAHVLRITTVIALIALWFRVIEGHAVSGVPTSEGTAPGWGDLALMVACVAGGRWLGPALRLPAGAFTGALVLSAALHLAGVVEGAPPAVAVIAAQVVLGSVLGCRFTGARGSELREAGLLSLGATALTLGAGLMLAGLFQAATGLPRDQLLLAYAPGGLTEMTLVAVAVGADLAFVTLHHVARLLMIIGLAPVIFGFVAPAVGQDHDAP
jgi:membrane AbrB-like protein